MGYAHTPSEQAGPGHALLLGASHYLGCRYLCTLCLLFFVSHVLLSPAPFSCGHVNAHVRFVGFTPPFYLLRLCVVWWRLFLGPSSAARGPRGSRSCGSGWLVRIDGGSSRAWRVDGEREKWILVWPVLLCLFLYCTNMSRGKVGPGSSTLCVVVRACWEDGCRRPEAALSVKRQIYEYFASE